MMERVGPSEVIAHTATGGVVGYVNGSGHAEFRGIPYAADPSSSNRRFLSPVPHSGWVGLLDCTITGASCPQPIYDYWGRPGNEPRAAWGNGGNWYSLFHPTYIPGPDYLNLNITTPVDTGSEAPVIVYIHGGAFSFGNNAMPIYNSNSFADLGIVFVAINYRLGFEGFGLVPGGEANVGILDQIAALKWVQENIREFGGDPRNVTIMGQSAGAQSSSLLLMSDLSEGLFARVIAMSSGVPGALSYDDAFENSRRIAEDIGIEHSREEFLKLSEMDLVEAVHSQELRPVRRCPHGRMNYAAMLIPCVDGEVIPEDFRTRYTSGYGERPMLMGITADESAWRVYQTEAHEYLTKDGVLRYLQDIVEQPQQIYEEFMRVYPGSSPADVKARVMYYDMYLKNIVPAIDSRSKANPGALYCYLFDEKSQGGSGKYGAFHLADLAYIFNVLETPGGLSMQGGLGSRESAQRMREEFANFARSGQVPWPALSEDFSIRYYGPGERELLNAYGNGDLLDLWVSKRKSA